MEKKMNEVAKRDDGGQLIADIVLNGDLSRLKPEQKVEYYNRFCESLGLNPLTRPFQYIKLSGKEVLYATKDATEQLRKLNGVSITDIKRDPVGDVCLVTVHGVDKTGRTDVATGAVPMVYPERYKDKSGNWVNHPRAGKSLTGDDLANALMKTETKAKRRLTLSICGLGILDETELETIPDAKPVKVALAEREIPDMDVARQTLNKLIEGYRDVLSDAFITACEIDADGADIDKMREICVSVKEEGRKARKEAEREEAKDAAREDGITNDDLAEPELPDGAETELDIF
uniref:Uncharacterized protein n=1 Tax=viral metagenome TaxID=1070528 RepID=A0A6M3LIW9_9ZZZZ